MLSDQGKRRQALKRPGRTCRYGAEKKSLRKRSGCGLRYAGKGPHNKNQENHRGKQIGHCTKLEAILKRR